ncbi:MAG: GNAT family N-acetyltransferase [Devosia sp.]
MLDRPQTTGTEFVVSVHRTLPDDWPGVADLGDARGHVFQTREFLNLWLETFVAAAGIDARFVDVRDPTGALVLRVPLSIDTRRGLRTLGFADQSTADYCAPLLYPTTIVWTPELADALWAAIEAALPPVDRVRLEKMPAMVSDRVNPLFLLRTEVNPESCHGSDLLRPWSEIEATQTQLKTLKRKARALEKLGPVAFVVATDEADRQRLLSRLLAQKQRRFEDTKVPGFAESPETKRFFERATDVYAELGVLHLAALEVGGELVATSWTVAVGSTIYELMIGFEDGEWAKYSPGRVLNLRYLEWAKSQGFAYLDHGIGDEAWKHENCDTHVPLSRMVVLRTARGRRAARRTALVARLRLTRLYQALRPWKWIVKRALKR